MGYSAEGQASCKQVHFGCLACGRVDERHFRPCPDDLHDPPCFVAQAAHDIFGNRKAFMSFAKSVIAHERLPFLGALLAIFRMKTLRRLPHRGQTLCGCSPNRDLNTQSPHGPSPGIRAHKPRDR